MRSVPIVIAAWEDDARSLGWPDSAVGWAALQTRAQQDANFRWSHPSTAYASGLLATLAEFYAGAGVQRGLTVEMAQDQKTVDFVSAIEKTVKFYGEAELAIMERVAADPNLLDAFVVSEQLVVAFNTGLFGRTPASGSLHCTPRRELSGRIILWLCSRHGAHSAQISERRSRHSVNFLRTVKVRRSSCRPVIVPRI
jgi:hypothetical protein